MANSSSSAASPAAVPRSPTEGDEQVFGAAYDSRVIRRFLAFMWPYRARLAVALGGVVVFTVTQLSIPLVIRATIDRALRQGAVNGGLLDTIALGFLAVILINLAAMYVQETIVGKTAERILFDLRRAMYVHLQRLSMSFMDRTQVGRLMSRLQGDVGALQEFLDTTVTAVGDILLLAGIVTVLLWLDWQLGLLTLSVVLTLLIVRMIWLPMAKKAFMWARQTSSIVNGALAENINGVRTVQEMLRERVNFDRFEVKARDNLKAHLKAAKFSQIMIPIVDTLTATAMAIVVVVGGGMVLRGSLDLGVMVAFIFYVQRFFDPIRSLTIQYSVMQKAMASGQRIFEVMDVPVDIQDRPDAIELKEIDGSIEFRNVTFGYLPGQPVLNDISFRVEPGETVAIVGPTGSGKTSITSLIHRFYDIWEGQVLVGGHDVRDVTQHSLGRQVGMVLQEPFLFTGTIFENIRYGKEQATRKEVIEAATAVGAHGFIERLPKGYDTVLAQRGGNLSLGQRQLISFARALVADTKILVLDEATASIDSYTERQIQLALKRLLEGRTGIVIAHRLATIRGADRIIVLNRGRIVETGTHRELLQKRGLYHRLYSMNYASFDDIPSELIRETTDEPSST
jgi:ATP-binding cassette, subfamily B, multidrug efflux pump